MKKFLIKAIATAVSLTAASGSCLAWTNQEIRAEYEKKFGWYTDNCHGLRAIISLLVDIPLYLHNSRECLQEYLETNYNVFKTKFDQVTEEDLNRKFEAVRKKYYSPNPTLGRFNKSPFCSKEREREKKELGDFSKQDAFNIKMRIQGKFGENVKKRTDLLDLAKRLSEATNIKLSRGARRDTMSLLKWFSTNWTIICNVNLQQLQSSQMPMPPKQEPVVDEGSTPPQQEPVVDEGSTPPQQDPTVDEDSTPSQQEPIFDDSFFFSDDSLFPSDDYYSFCFDDFFPAFF